MTDHAIDREQSGGAHLRWPVALALAASIVIAASAVVVIPHARPFLERVSRSQTVAFYASPIFWIAIAATLLLERLVPARRQAVFSRSLRTDASYIVITHTAGFLINLLWVAALRGAYDRWLGFLTVQAAASWPFALRLVLGILLVDLIAWAHHWVRHRVPLFWHFHAVHHAQRELNVFTDLRYHPLEYLVTTTIGALPMFALGNALPTVAAWSTISNCYTKFTHANVRTRLGPLRSVLVTPQSHRIHHSVDVADRDTNYGVVFSIWDRLFGTQSPRDDTYPETGIDDPAFPDEWRDGASLLLAPIRHFAYPFRAARRRRAPVR